MNIKFNVSSLLLILFGLIAIVFPLFSTMTIGLITGFSFLMVTLLLFVTSSSIYKENSVLGIVLLIIAILSLILSLLLVFNPEMISVISSYIVYILGFFMIFSGILHIIPGREFRPLLGMGIITLIFGIFYIILAMYLNNPVHMGILIGVWLLLSGILNALDVN